MLKNVFFPPKESESENRMFNFDTLTKLPMIIRELQTSFSKSTSLNVTFKDKMIRLIPKVNDVTDYDRLKDFFYLFFISYFVHMEAYELYFGNEIWDFWLNFTNEERYGINGNLYEFIDVRKKRLFLGLQGEINESILLLIQPDKPIIVTPRIIPISKPISKPVLKQVSPIQILFGEEDFIPDPPRTTPSPIISRQSSRSIRLGTEEEGLEKIRRQILFSVIRGKPGQIIKPIKEDRNGSNNRELQLMLSDFLSKNVKYNENRKLYKNMVFGNDPNFIYLNKLRGVKSELLLIFNKLTVKFKSITSLNEDTRELWESVIEYFHLNFKNTTKIFLNDRKFIIKNMKSNKGLI